MPLGLPPLRVQELVRAIPIVVDGPRALRVIGVPGAVRIGPGQHHRAGIVGLHVAPGERKRPGPVRLVRGRHGRGPAHQRDALHCPRSGVRHLGPVVAPGVAGAVGTQVTHHVAVGGQVIEGEVRVQALGAGLPGHRAPGHGLRGRVVVRGHRGVFVEGVHGGGHVGRVDGGVVAVGRVVDPASAAVKGQHHAGSRELGGQGHPVGAIHRRAAIREGHALAGPIGPPRLHRGVRAGEASPPVREMLPRGQEAVGGHLGGDGALRVPPRHRAILVDGDGGAVLEGDGLVEQVRREVHRGVVRQGHVHAAVGALDRRDGGSRGVMGRQRPIRREVQLEQCEAVVTVLAPLVWVCCTTPLGEVRTNPPFGCRYATMPSGS